MSKTDVKIFPLLILLAVGCAMSEETQISDSQFVMLYVDLSFAAESFLSDSVVLATVQDSIFETHGVTRERFFEYKERLDESPERWSAIWELIASELKTREEALSKSLDKSESRSKKEQPEE